MNDPHCPKHPQVKLTCPSCAGGQAGGRRTSPRKRRTARNNGKRGGRPSRLTAREVREIWNSQTIAARETATRYGISEAYVYRIRRRRPGPQAG